MKKIAIVIVLGMVLMGLTGCPDGATCTGGGATIQGNNTTSPTNNQPVNSGNTTETTAPAPATAG